MLAILMLSSCKTTTKLVEVPVEVIKKEYIHDTRIDITKWHTKYKYINKVDTILKTDTIPKVVPVEKEVEVNHIYWWQKTLMWLGGIMTMLFVGIITYKIKFND